MNVKYCAHSRKKKSSKKRIERLIEDFNNALDKLPRKKKSSKKRIERLGMRRGYLNRTKLSGLAKRNPQKRGLKGCSQIPANIETVCYFYSQKEILKKED